MALRKASRLGERTTMVCNTNAPNRPPDIIALVSPMAMCADPLYPLQDTVWKNWRTLVTLLQLYAGRVAEYINIFEENFWCFFFWCISPVMVAAMPTFPLDQFFAL